MSVSTTAALPALVDEYPPGIARPHRFGPNPKLQGREARLEDRLEHDLHRGLHDPVTYPGPDLHRQATTSFRSGHNRWTITS